MASKHITQETFDAAVLENIEEFEMGPEEAVKEAVEQFESQGKMVRLCPALSGSVRLCSGSLLGSPLLSVALNVQECCPAVAPSRLAWQPWAPFPLHTLPQAGWRPPSTCLDLTQASAGRILQGGLLLIVTSSNKHFLTTSQEIEPPTSMPHLHPCLSSRRQKYMLITHLCKQVSGVMLKPGHGGSG